MQLIASDCLLEYRYKHLWQVKVYELVIKEYGAADSKQSGHVSGNK